jgi:tetratricopeptide (TPR) repeat protein
MNNSLEDIKLLYKLQRYREAISLIELLEEENHLYPDLLVWKGRCLQLIDYEPKYQFADIEKAFREALNFDNENLLALVELAYFYLNVADDAERASKLFEKAINLYKEQMTEAVVGMTKCVFELESSEAALIFLNSAVTNSLEAQGIEEVRKELESAE